MKDTTDTKRTEEQILAVCNEIASMLIEKNRSYGDSALNPIRIFSKADAEAGINVRLDDKLSRIASGNEGAFQEDVELDIMGYLILKRVGKKRKALEAAQAPTNIRAHRC